MPKSRPDSIFKSSAIALEHWYDRNKRNMPWRETKAPYKIWLSEVILQQTRVEQGLPYYISFLESFPNVFDLANADEDRILRAWQGLGYYSRARNLHKAAKMVAKEFKGEFPTDYKSLLRLPGVGPYTAAAIASICAEEETPVVDGNVQRLISRHFLVEEAIDTAIGSKLIHSLASSWIKDRKPSRFNQAMMELGAMVCTPRNPSCANCPISDTCLALREKKVEALPKKKTKKAVVSRYLIYHVHLSKERTWIKKRGERDIWAGLYEWPSEEVTSEAYLHQKKLSSTMDGHHFTHVLSHQRIHALFLIHKRPYKMDHGEALAIAWRDLDDYPMSRLMTRFLDLYQAT